MTKDRKQKSGSAADPKSLEAGYRPPERTGRPRSQQKKSLRKGAKTQSVRSPRVSKGAESLSKSLHTSPSISATSTSIFSAKANTSASTKNSELTSAHSGQTRREFAVWAPNADQVSVRRELQRLGWQESPDAAGGPLGHLGSLHRGT